MHSISTKKIFLWRLSHAVLWSVLMQVFFLFIYLCVLNVDIVHPISWIKQTFFLLTSFHTWLRLIPSASILFMQGVFCGKEYTVQQASYTTRFAFFLHLFSVHNLLLCALHMVSGGLTVWLYLSMLGGRYSSLAKTCSTQEKSCIVEGNLFLLLSGLSNGFYYFIKDHILTPALLTFPPIQQRKFIQVKSSLGMLFKKAMRDSLLPILIFALFYYVYGSMFKNTVSSFFRAAIEDEPLDKLFYMVNPSIIFYAWLFSTLFLTTMYTMTMLFNVYLTERNCFPIESTENCMTLSEALSNSPEIVTKLAAQDLMEMAYKDRTRRNLVFSLSQPGGHPTNWTNLSNQCLQIINRYTGDLNHIIGEKTIDHPVTPPKRAPPPSEMIKSPRLRNLAMSSPASPVTQKFITAEQEPLLSVLKKEFNVILSILCKKPGISFFFGEMTELKLKWVVLRGQVVARVAQGLSQLVATSLTEDNYGVVQDDLSAIITSLLHLKQTLDKLTKSGIANKKSLRNDTIVTQMLLELKSAVKRSIYKITVTFGVFIRDIPLDSETLQALQPFIHMREG